MKTRTVFSARDLVMASACIRAARNAGVDEDISLVVRSDMSGMIPDDRKIVEGDFYPAAVRGVLGGGALGLLLGLTAVAIPPLGITVAGSLAMALSRGRLVDGAGRFGDRRSDPVRVRGRDRKRPVLVVIDASNEFLGAAKRAIERKGARPLPFKHLSIAS